MAVLLSPLGFTAGLALAPLRDRTDIDAIHVFYGAPAPPEGIAALQEARIKAKGRRVPLVAHAVKGAFDYQAVLNALSQAYGQTHGEDVVVNGSAGTRPMVMAATIFAFTHDLPLLYYDEYQTQQGKQVPLRAFRNLGDLGETRRSIVQRLAKGPADMATLAADVGIAPSTLSVHVHKLAESGIVTIERQGKRRVVTGVPAVLSMHLEVHA